MDAWVWIPFMMILLLAGLQALPLEVKEAAKVDGANRWQTFWEITFPLMLPVSVTAIVLRIIFELKLADIVINVTAGGPGGATDTVSSFVYREYRDRSNVGYGTMLAEVYLVIIIIFITLLLKAVSEPHAADDVSDVDGRTGGDDRNQRRDADGAASAKPARSPLGRALRRTHRRLRRSCSSGPSSALFPIYWTLTTSFKVGRRRHPGPSHPLGRLLARLARLALARPVARHDLRHLERRATSSSSASSTASSSSVGASLLAVVIGSLAAYGLSRFDYKFGPWRNKDISFFFLSQLILPPVVLALPFLVLYKELALLDTRDRPHPASTR